MAAGIPAAVSMKRTSGFAAGSNRSARMEKNIPYGLVPSALNTWTTLALDSGLAGRNRYGPAGNVTPGMETGPLKVNSVRLSRGCALLDVTVTQSRATEQAKKTLRLRMCGPPVTGEPVRSPSCAVQNCNFDSH